MSRRTSAATRSAEKADRGIWEYRRGLGSSGDLEGFVVEGDDGRVGEVLAADAREGAGFVIVAGGDWIDGRMLMLPAGLLARVDRGARVAVVAVTREQIWAAPAFEGDRYQDRAYRLELGQHYEQLGGAPAGAQARGSRSIRAAGGGGRAGEAWWPSGLSGLRAGSTPRG